MFDAKGALLVGVLVVLSGCIGGVAGPSATGGDADPSATGGDADPTLADLSLPDGVTANGTNASALLSAHAEALENRSFTVRLSVSRSAGDAERSFRSTVRVGADRDRVRTRTNGSNGSVDAYLAGGQVYLKRTVRGETRYAVHERRPGAKSALPASPSAGASVGRFVGSVNLTPTGVRVRDGTPLVVLTADGLGASFAPNGTSANVTVLVDQQGLVHEVRASVSGESRDGEPVSVSYRFRVTDVGGTTVPEPGWLDEAREQSEG